MRRICSDITFKERKRAKSYKNKGTGCPLIPNGSDQPSISSARWNSNPFSNLGLTAMSSREPTVYSPRKGFSAKALDEETPHSFWTLALPHSVLEKSWTSRGIMGRRSWEEEIGGFYKRIGCLVSWFPNHSIPFFKLFTQVMDSSMSKLWTLAGLSSNFLLPPLAQFPWWRNIFGSF